MRHNTAQADNMSKLMRPSKKSGRQGAKGSAKNSLEGSGKGSKGPKDSNGEREMPLSYAGVHAQRLIDHGNLGPRDARALQGLGLGPEDSEDLGYEVLYSDSSLSPTNERFGNGG